MPRGALGGGSATSGDSINNARRNSQNANVTAIFGSRMHCESACIGKRVGDNLEFLAVETDALGLSVAKFPYTLANLGDG